MEHDNQTVGNNIIKQDLSDEGLPVDVEHEDEERETHEPFDPEKISIDSKVVSMDTLIRRLLQGTYSPCSSFSKKNNLGYRA